MALAIILVVDLPIPDRRDVSVLAVDVDVELVDAS